MMDAPSKDLVGEYKEVMGLSTDNPKTVHKDLFAAALAARQESTSLPGND